MEKGLFVLKGVLQLPIRRWYDHGISWLLTNLHLCCLADRVRLVKQRVLQLCVLSRCQGLHSNQFGREPKTRNPKTRARSFQGNMPKPLCHASALAGRHCWERAPHLKLLALNIQKMYILIYIYIYTIILLVSIIVIIAIADYCNDDFCYMCVCVCGYVYICIDVCVYMHAFIHGWMDGWMGSICTIISYHLISHHMI